MNKDKDFIMPRNDHLDIYSKLSAEDILKWLYQANKFISQIKDINK